MSLHFGLIFIYQGMVEGVKNIERKQVGHNINHQDFVFEKGL